MTPNVASKVLPSYAPKLTVAMRKEANEMRKTLKPLMEKRRRARINDSLDHLKSLILPLIGKDNSRYSKLEKADILEMTVRFLSDLPNSPVKNTSDNFKKGYKACLQRVSTLLPRNSLLDKDTCQRVDEYIQKSMAAVEAPACQNCCAKNSRVFPQVNHRVRIFNCSGNPKAETHSNSALPPNRAPQPVPPVLSGNMWRPW
ncbi:transcription factor HES-2-like [Anguilla rostrata]|uniref:transcription factor HES-2-like n=1 Tax=Anguilla anguilla TaxID=7936 RepID=UPI0015AF468B|nr:transcription factor HES-2-like [Anguilla anguilla]